MRISGGVRQLSLVDVRTATPYSNDYDCDLPLASGCSVVETTTAQDCIDCGWRGLFWGHRSR